ncbi:lysine-specific demethylase 8-like isoform X4 [Dermacentor silvarum]|uniref:lysine-specific demethylase 8-like isoform X4 n=1 Tax=Dermacentor silvarum TaxID=543639 RepID=UPI002100D0B6|nr:lysine-specific demethylase 8-like isoform X4 [Dermacentor silvarum]
MVSLADKHLGLPVAFVADDFDDEEDPVMYLLKECVKFVNHPHACEDVTTLQENFESARAICDMSWEMLNIGDWKDVPPRWRRMYSYGSLLKALCELGQAKPTEIECKEPHSITLKFPLSRLACPSVEHFMKTYLNAEKPVIITKGMDYWPALSTRPWSIRYLVTIAGGRTVPVELGSKYTDEDWSQKLMTLASFVRTYILKEKGPDVGVGYMAQHQLFHEIPELRNDICIPTYCCLSEKDEEPDINLWFGPEGTVSPLHHDPKNNILAQVFGEKYIRLYGKSQTPFLYAHEERLLENTSQVDVEDPDTEKFPLFEKAEYTECVLRPGEMLFIPPKCWHFVRSLSPSLSISFWWE